MTAQGVTPVALDRPQEPDSWEPADQDGAAPEETPVTEETPITEEALVTEETPADDETLADDETHADDETPADDGTSAPEESPVTAVAVPVEETSAADTLELELRGRLTVAKRVIEKIAQQAAVEVTGDGEHQTAFAVRPGATMAARPTVEVQLEGSDAWLTIEVGLTYPTPLRAAADELREHLVKRLEELSGVTVKRLDIRISWLGATVKQPRRLR